LKDFLRINAISLDESNWFLLAQLLNLLKISIASSKYGRCLRLSWTQKSGTTRPIVMSETLAEPPPLGCIGKARLT
jgi:hypothetical protein